MLHSHFRPHFLPFHGQHLYSPSPPTRFLHLLHLSIFFSLNLFFFYFFTLFYSLFSSPSSLNKIDVPLVEFMYLVFTHMSDESYRRRLRSLLLYLCYVLRALINSLVLLSVFFTFFFYQICLPCFSVHFLGLYLHLSMQSLYLLLLSIL